VFRLLPPQTPSMIGVTLVGGAAQVSFAGVSGLRYQAERSINLTNWTVLVTTTMPFGGVYTNLDSKPPGPAAYYRAAWVP